MAYLCEGDCESVRFSDLDTSDLDVRFSDLESSDLEVRFTDLESSDVDDISDTRTPSAQHTTDLISSSQLNSQSDQSLFSQSGM